jgi:adenylate cyclase
MAREIERKYLVADPSLLAELEGVAFKQGYIPVNEGVSVRIRLMGDRAVLTLKGRTEGIGRSEFEYEIPFADAEAMLEEFCTRPLIEKTRYKVEHAGKIWEVDIFAGDNEGLVLAEVELESEDEVVEKPPWVGEEVSDDPRYYNASLVHNPYCKWKDV